MNTEPKLEQRSAQPYAGIRSTVSVQEISSALPPLFDEVFGWLAQRGIAPAGAPIFRYLYIDMPGKLVIDVGWPTAALVEGDGRVIGDELPGGQYAVLVHTGPYPELEQATGVLSGWAQQQGIVWDEQSDHWAGRAEHYLTDPGEEPDPAKWETEIAIKVAG